MAYDKTKDELLWWKMGPGSIRVSVNRYNRGPIRVQLGPRLLKVIDGKEMWGKLGRMSLDEWDWLVAQAEPIKIALGLLDDGEVMDVAEPPSLM